MEIRILIYSVIIFCLFSCEETENTLHIESIQANCYHVDSIVRKRVYASFTWGAEFQDTSLVMIDFKLSAIPVSKGVNIMAPITGMDGKTDSILGIQVLDGKGRDVKKLFQASDNKSFCIRQYKKNEHQNVIRGNSPCFPIVPIKKVDDITELYNNSRRFKPNDTLMINNSFVFLMKDSLFEHLRPIKFSLSMLEKKSNRRYKINGLLDR